MDHRESLDKVYDACFICATSNPRYTEPDRPIVNQTGHQPLSSTHHSPNNNRIFLHFPPHHQLHEMAPFPLFFNIHTDDWGSHRTGTSSLATAVGGFLTDLWGSHRGGSTSATAVRRSIEHGQAVYCWAVNSFTASTSNQSRSCSSYFFFADEIRHTFASSAFLVERALCRRPAGAVCRCALLLPTGVLSAGGTKTGGRRGGE